VSTTASEQLASISDPVVYDDLTSVLSHAAEGRRACVEYIDDAAREGDTELVEFFKEVQKQEAWRAQKAKTLISRR
jgi:hypothetical protein